MKYFDKKALKDFQTILKENQSKTKTVPIIKQQQKKTDENLSDFLLKCIDEAKLFPKNKTEEIIKPEVLEIIPEKKIEEIKPDYYPNASAFTCPLCNQTIAAKKGITLYNCIHSFCLTCLKAVILENSTTEVLCPFMEIDCNELLLDSEIKVLISLEDYHNHLDKSLLKLDADDLSKTEVPKKWLCTTCQLLNSYIKNRCAFCDLEKPKPIIKKSQYEELLTLEEGEIIECYEEFECLICTMEYGIGEGFMLRECLHVFCKECLSHQIINSESPEVKCPYMTDDYSCDCFLQDREIRSAITQQDYEKYLEKSLKMAERGIKESYHCLTVDCHGWWINEDEANAINCPVCGIQNCLNCNVSAELKKYVSVVFIVFFDFFRQFIWV